MLCMDFEICFIYTVKESGFVFYGKNSNKNRRLFWDLKLDSFSISSGRISTF